MRNFAKKQQTHYFLSQFTLFCCQYNQYTIKISDKFIKVIYHNNTIFNPLITLMYE